MKTVKELLDDLEKLGWEAALLQRDLNEAQELGEDTQDYEDEQEELQETIEQLKLEILEFFKD